jgi:hypothetical protein
MNWNESEFDELASELRRQVGGEFRLEAEAVEEDATKHSLRRRTLGDVAFELMNRGDEIGVTGAGASFAGTITHTAGDLAIVITPHSLLNVNLAGPISLRVIRRSHGGGHGQQVGSQSYRARMLEIEMSGEFVEIVSLATQEPLAGTISIVGRDHVVAVDSNETEWFVPLSSIAFTLQR